MQPKGCIRFWRADLTPRPPLRNGAGEGWVGVYLPYPLEFLRELNCDIIHIFDSVETKGVFHLSLSASPSFFPLQEQKP